MTVTKIKKKMITLADLKPKAFKLQLEVPGHSELDVWVELVGTESREYAESAAKLFKDRGGKKDSDIDIEQAIKEGACLTSSLIKNWGPIEFFGQEFNYDAAVDILSDFDYKWLRQQIDDAAGERDNFFTS